MKRYYVLVPTASWRKELETKFIRDGFSWIRFLLPLPWLLFRRLWWPAAFVFLLYLFSIVAADLYNMEILPLAFSVIISLWVGLEGGHIRAEVLRRKGWILDAVVLAPSLDDAELSYFSRNEESESEEAAPAMAPTGRTSAGTERPSLALGLIGPYGGR
jgi:hypothetical protein